ncbi:hypothetical protein NQ176_g5401 [Zarea fungicola]|uniref:Uncharacterized protein n=1 Tax=Zarea fungicola TaxID=93591 RepID=A0ACC1NB25_9HYPO|nr:hypothetical protein NQ176_g5401 [Lecanicillium fungicola]
MALSRFEDIILDINGVILRYSTNIRGGLLPARTIKNILDSPDWHCYEKGKISQEASVKAIASRYGLSQTDWEAATEELKSTLDENLSFIAAIAYLKSCYSHIRVHAFTNMTSPDYKYLKARMENWHIFDNIVTSSSIGHRKPDAEFFKRALQAVDAEAETSVFVDDRRENVIMAHSLGMRAILFDSTSKVISQLHNCLGDPIDRGYSFLCDRKKGIHSETDHGVLITDNFSQLLVLQCIGNK